MPHFRFDTSRFSKTRMTDEGYLETEAIATRTGIFLYRNADGSIRKELRHPDDVFKADSLKSLQMIPITDGHPEGRLVDSKNAKSLQIGQVGQNIKVDGKFIRVPLTITNSDSIEKIKRGKNQLSLGYTANVVDESGEYNGQKYNSRQKDIKYNHLATCSIARAGADASIKLDEGDAILLDDEEIKNITDDDSNDKTKPKRGKSMKKITLDGIEYEAAPEVENALTKKQARVDALTAENEKNKGTLDALKEENTNLKTKVDEFDKTLNEKVQSFVKERVAVVDAAKSILDKETKFDEMSILDIKKAVISKVSKNAKLDDASKDYIDARFDAAIETTVERKDMSDQRKGVGASEGTSDSGKTILEDAHENYLKNLRGEK